MAVIDPWFGRPVSASLPWFFLDHFWSTSLVADDAEGLAGFLVAFVSPSQPHLGYVPFAGLRPDRRRSGLARQLYEEFVDRARTLGGTELAAITAIGKHRLDPLHRRLGFAVSEPVPDYNGPDRPRVTFSGRLR